MLLADISSGNTGFADVCFLIALILFLVAGFIAFQAKTVYATVICLGLAAVSLGWLVL